MGIMLGNLSVSEIESRLKIELTDEDKKFFIENRQEKVNKTPLGYGKWHCFDIPFIIVCDREETAIAVRDRISKYNISGTVQIGWER